MWSLAAFDQLCCENLGEMCVCPALRKVAALGAGCAELLLAGLCFLGPSGCRWEVWMCRKVLGVFFVPFYRKNLGHSNHLPFPLCWQFNSLFKSFGFSQVRSPHTCFNSCVEAWSLTIILLKLSETCHKTFFFFKCTHANDPHQIILLNRE